MHMFLGTLREGKLINGYINNGLVEVHNIINRHDELAEEMKRREYNHKSPIDYDLMDFDLWEDGCVNSEQNIVELHRRCPDCRERIECQNS